MAIAREIFMSEVEFVVFKAREYLEHVSPDYAEVISDWRDERVLKEVNRIFFGGLQAFARVCKKEGIGMDSDTPNVLPNP